jgi:hypothetical protein
MEALMDVQIKTDGYDFTSKSLGQIGNCRLVKTYKALSEILLRIEAEIERRSGSGGGGLK